MPKLPRQPVALTLAGSDSGGVADCFRVSQPAAMKVMVELPERLLEHPQDAGREIVRELSLSAFARGRISRRELREQLGLDRWSLETLLAERGLLPKVTLDEADADAAPLTCALA